MHFLRSDWFTKSRLSAHIPKFDLIWKTIAPGVAKLKIFLGGKRTFLRKNGEKKKRNTRQYHLNETTIKATKFGMTIFNGAYL